MKMDHRDADHLLSSKIGLVPVARGRHKHYVFGDHRIGLPAILCISHGNDELSNSNIKGLAQGLGMSSDGVCRGSKCHVGKECALLCMAICVLSRLFPLAKRHVEEDPIVRGNAVKRLAESVTLILDLVGAVPPDPAKWRPLERKELARARQQLSAVPKHPDIARISERLLQWSAVPEAIA
ncbi:MAG TPA: hypothetical protein VHD56_11740 [Tepidisphaeraceae bacterium]|nr:hypothetical protein [Tepidisphaeraceae bacterium]